jgi:hypothetical protein
MAQRHMNVEIGAQAALFPEKEYINGIAVEVYEIGPSLLPLLFRLLPIQEISVMLMPWLLLVCPVQNTYFLLTVHCFSSFVSIAQHVG